MGLKPGYKQTKVGVLPADWKVTTLGEVCSMKSGEAITGAAIDQFSRYACYGGNGLRGLTSRYTHDGRHALIGRQGALCGNVIGVEGKFFASEHAVVVTAFPAIDIRWLTYVLGELHLHRYSESSAQPGLSVSRLLRLQLAIPSSEGEQRAIAEALSDVDTLIGTLDRLTAKKRDLKQTAMQQLLTGQKRLPGFNGKWEIKRLGDVLTRVVNGAVYRPTNSLGLPITRIETISDGTIDLERIGYAEPTAELTKYKLERGDILFSHINSVDHLGKVAIFGGETDLYHGMNLLLLRAGPGIDSEYLFYWLGSRQGRQRSMFLAKQAVSQASINTSELKGIEVRLPPFSEQTAIAKVLSDMDAEITALERRRDKTRALKQCMMQELLSGRVRLVAPASVKNMPC